MKKSLVIISLLVFTALFSSCAGLNEYFVKANYDRQESEGQTVITGGYTEAYYAAMKVLQDQGLKIVSPAQSEMPLTVVGESYKMRSEGDRLGGTVVMSLIGGKKAAEKVVEKEVKRRTFVIKARFDSTWTIVPGKIGVLLSGDKTGRNGQGVIVETMEKTIPVEEEMHLMERLKAYIVDYTKYPEKMGK